MRNKKPNYECSPLSVTREAENPFFAYHNSIFLYRSANNGVGMSNLNNQLLIMARPQNKAGELVRAQVRPRLINILLIVKLTPPDR